MTSSSRTPLRGWPNIPPPPGSKAAVSYARIIPAEELAGYDSWQPPALMGAAAAPPSPLTTPARLGVAATAAPAPEVPDEAQWLERVEAARREGFDQGQAEGLSTLQALKAEHEATCRQQMEAELRRWLERLDEQWAALEPAWADALTRSVLGLSRAVLRAELRTHPEHVQSLAQEAVKTLVHSARRVELHAHPDDLPLLQTALGELLDSRGARLVGDASVQRGGCRVASDIAEVDARLETRWALACATLGQALPWQATGPGEPADTP